MYYQQSFMAETISGQRLVSCRAAQLYHSWLVGCRPSMKLECGPMPNVMVALPNIGGALCSTPQNLAEAQYLTAVQ